MWKDQVGKFNQNIMIRVESSPADLDIVGKKFLRRFCKILTIICHALRDLVPFVQFKNCEKHPWRSVNCSKVAG